MKKYLLMLPIVLFYITTKAQQQIVINTLTTTTQSTRFEVARMYIDVVNWNIAGNLEIDLKEGYHSGGLKKTYTLSYGYQIPPNSYLKDMSGIGDNIFQLSIGSEVVVSGSIKYVPIYIDLLNYSHVDVIISTNWRLTTDPANTNQGYLYYNQSPTGVSIADFTPDVTVFLANAAANTIFNGKVGIGTTTPADIFEVAKSSTAKFKVYTPSGYTYPSDFGAGVLGLGLTRGDGIYTNGMYSYTSTNGSDNLALGSRSDIVFLAGSADLGNQPEALRIKEGTGYVGVGTTSPGQLLTLSRAMANTTIGLYSTNTNSTNRNWTINSNDLAYGDFDICTSTANGGDPRTAGVARLYINTAGNIGIGTTDPKGYKLAVAGNAIAESMTVKLQANWPDYVFKPGHSLLPLTEVKNYIDKNQHLPEVPSAAEIQKDGLNVGEMEKILTKKIEELTLYLIDLKKDNDELKSQNLQLKQNLEIINKKLDQHQ